MATQVVLTYDCDLGLLLAISGSTLFNRIANFNFDPGGFVASFLGLTLSGDVTSVLSTNVVRRRLTYSVGAQANQSFPSAALLGRAVKHQFRGLFQMLVPCRVTELDPVVT